MRSATFLDCKARVEGLSIYVDDAGEESSMSGSMSAAANARADADQRPWLKFYPPGVPAEIDVERVGTLVDLFRDSVSRYAIQPALESFGKRMTYAELGEAADAVASWLQGRGLGKGDRVAVMLPNVLAYPAILFGALI